MATYGLAPSAAGPCLPPVICGDVCAMLYTRSRAMHSEVIHELSVPPETDRRPLTKKASNAQIAIRRLIENHLKDDERQRALEMILSNPSRSQTIQISAYF